MEVKYKYTNPWRWRAIPVISASPGPYTFSKSSCHNSKIDYRSFCCSSVHNRQYWSLGKVKVVSSSSSRSSRGTVSCGHCSCFTTTIGVGGGRIADHLTSTTVIGKQGCLLRREGKTRKRASLKIMALDAAMPFDYEARAHREINNNNSKWTIGIVGFGSFGQFLGRRLVEAGFNVIATSRSPYDSVAASMGISYFRDADDFCESHPDVVILSTSILSMEKVLESLPVQRLRRNTLFIDVLSVKVFPKRVLLTKLPAQVDILCTHPMFGPDSGKGSWKDLNFMYEKVRIGKSDYRQQRCADILAFFEREGCNMVQMTCEEHDKAAASTQFITHTVGRMLGEMSLESTPIDTRGYKSLLNLVDNTANDSFELYYGLFMYNENATQELDRLEKAFDGVRRQLFSRLHDRVRSQLFLSDTHSTSEGDHTSESYGNVESNNGSTAKDQTSLTPDTAK